MTFRSKEEGKIVNSSVAVSELPVAVLVGLGLLAAVQLTLQVFALVQLVKTPPDRVSIGGRKWAWALIIVLGEIAGPILWFVLGRRPAPAAEPTPGVPVATRAVSAADALYGAPQEPESR